MHRLLALMMVTAANAAQAQATRCEAPDGKVTYVGGACPAGTRAARAIDAVPPASAEERKSAETRAAADRKQAEALAKQQRAEEEKQARERAEQAEREKKIKQHCAKLDVDLRHAQEDVDRATPKQRDAAERKLRRAQESYAAQCPQ
jgi:hypothetical protein